MQILSHKREVSDINAKELYFSFGYAVLQIIIVRLLLFRCTAGAVYTWHWAAVPGCPHLR
jgi:hypothetical protein